MLSRLVRQTRTLDLAALIESPVPEHRHRQPSLAPYESIAGTVDKVALLQVLQEIEAESAEAQTAADPFPIAPNREYLSVGWGDPNVDGTKVRIGGSFSVPLAARIRDANGRDLVGATA